MTLHISVAQLNLQVGDMSGNARQIIDFSRQAHARGARLVLTPELSICGYAAQDLLLRPDFVAACQQAVAQVAQALADLPGLHVVVGHPFGHAQRTPSVTHTHRYNRASVLCQGRVVAHHDKWMLPNYQVFDESRYFVPGQTCTVADVDGVRVGLLICEDAWFAPPAQALRDAGAQVLVVLNASPFHLGKAPQREAQMRLRVAECGLPLVYAHMVGGQDEWVFDGHSFALDAQGNLISRAAGFVTDGMDVVVHAASAGGAVALTAALPPDGAGRAAVQPLPATPEAELWQALVLGVRDYVGKNGFKQVVFGMSGGIDSALVLAIAVDALGPQAVHAVMMPSPYTADISWQDSRSMVANLGVRYDEIAIGPLFEGFKQALAGQFAGLAEDATEENLQARIRGTLLMALSNKTGALVLTTGNKSEMATGYCTLYGDMAGGFAVLKDVLKTRVFALARWRNAHDPFARGASPIPERIITRPPSAELRPDQKDQDSLPPYAVLDALIEGLMENDASGQDMVAAGFERADVLRVARLLKHNEYKRRQAPEGIRVSPRSFGKDWRYPMTHRFALA